MGRKKLKVDYLMQYGDEIALLRDGLSLRRVRSRTGRAINTLRKLRTLFVIWIMDTFPHPPQQPPSANPIPHIPIPQMTTVPTDATRRVLMQPVEPHRHSEACRPFSGWCNQTTGWARHHFQKSETYFEITLGRKPVGVHHGQRDRWTRKGNGVKWDG